MMACCGVGQGGNGFVCRGKKGGQLWSISVFVTHEHRGGANYANFANATASHTACVMR